MKKMITRLLTVALLGMSLAMTACTGDTTTQDAGTDDINRLDLKATLQGKIMDATTGAALTGDDLKVYLVQGTDNRTPDKLMNSTDVNNDLAGEYAFNNIPLDTGASTTSSVFKIVVVKGGYQRFEGTINLTSAANTNEGARFYDTVFNYIGNVYLFPVGATAADYTVKVRYNGAVVAGATVQLQQNATANNLTAATAANAPAVNMATNAANRLVAAPGLLPVLTATTDATGNAVFKGATLALNGSYTVTVLPVKAANGDQLELLQSATVPVIGAAITNTAANGTSTGVVVLGTEQTINMVGASNNDSSLFVTKISNSTAGIILDSGALTFTFNRPVQINNNNRAVSTASVGNGTGTNGLTGATIINVTNTVYGFGATIGSTANSLTAVLTQFGATAAVKPVVATLNAAGTELTLTPSFSTAKAASDFDLSVTYFDGPQAGNLPAFATSTTAGVTTNVTYAVGAAAAQPSVSPVGKPELQYNLFSVAGAGQAVMRNGALVGNTVDMTAPAAGL